MTGRPPRPLRAPADSGAEPRRNRPAGSRGSARLQALQIIIVLAVIVVIFSILKPSAS